jgi:hypothetical protein
MSKPTFNSCGTDHLSWSVLLLLTTTAGIRGSCAGRAEQRMTPLKNSRPAVSRRYTALARSERRPGRAEERPQLLHGHSGLGPDSIDAGGVRRLFHICSWPRGRGQRLGRAAVLADKGRRSSVPRPGFLPPETLPPGIAARSCRFTWLDTGCSERPARPPRMATMTDHKRRWSVPRPEVTLAL